MAAEPIDGARTKRPRYLLFGHLILCPQNLPRIMLNDFFSPRSLWGSAKRRQTFVLVVLGLFSLGLFFKVRAGMLTWSVFGFSSQIFVEELFGLGVIIPMVGLWWVDRRQPLNKAQKRFVLACISALLICLPLTLFGEELLYLDSYDGGLIAIACSFLVFFGLLKGYFGTNKIPAVYRQLKGVASS